MRFFRESKQFHLAGKLALVLGVALLASGLVSCKARTVKTGDVISQKETQKGRTPITVLVKHGFSINGFEKAVEAKFPDIDIIQVGNYTRNMGIEGYKAMLEHDDLTDIVMTWPLNVGEEYWADRLMDLSGMSFTTNYSISMLNNISNDGKLYYLPGPSQIRGIVYNQTLFEENSWEIPENYDEFIELCHTIEATGIKALQLGFSNAEVLDTAFVGYGYADCFSKPADKQWMDQYDQGQGSIGDHFGPALDTFQNLIREGIFTKDDLDVDYSEREKMFYTRQCAMIEDSVLMTKMGESLTGSSDKTALMPFYNPGDGDDWVRLYMVCYIGINKNLAEPASKEKYDLVMKLMDYISTPESQEAMMLDSGSMFSAVSGTALSDVPEISDLVPALSHGRYAVFPELKNAQSALREGLAGMLRGEMTEEDVIKMVDRENTAPSAAASAEVLGTADDDFSLVETGSFVTDVMRQTSGCDVALYLDDGKDGRHNAKGLSAKLYKGDVTTDDIGRILPDLKYGEQGVLWKTTMTGADLLKTLEYSLKVENDNEGWFYYISGLKLEFAPAADPGSRVKKITMADGSKFDPEHVYSVAVTEETVPDEYLITCDKTQQLLSDLLKSHITEQGTITPVRDGRFLVVETE